MRPFCSTQRRISLNQLIPVLILVIMTSSAASVWFTRYDRPPESFVLSERSSHFSSKSCAECHAEIVKSFAQTPHARTLMRATDKLVINEFAGKRFHRDESGVDFQYDILDNQLFMSTSAFSRKVPIDWIFGSGKHARTPLMTWIDSKGATSGLEHCVSAYPDGSLGTTLGMEELSESIGLVSLGQPRPPNEIANCFGCHCSHVEVTNDRIDFDKTQPGISCARCHWDTSKHLHDMGNDLTSTIERLSDLTPIESINRCGECHRRADELGGEIDPDDKLLPRFASVGLVQSKCFLQQEEIIHTNGQAARFDCTSCHNPHQPTRSDWQFHTAVCLNCHDATQKKAIDCKVAARTENCLTCHMPKVPAGKHIHFTDHWIRVQKLGQ